MNTITIIEKLNSEPQIEWWYHNDQELKFYVDNIATKTVDPKTVINTMFDYEVIDDYCPEKNLVFFQVPEEKVLTIYKRRPSTLYALKSGLYMCSARDYFNYAAPVIDSAANWLTEYFESNG